MDESATSPGRKTSRTPSLPAVKSEASVAASVDTIPATGIGTYQEEGLREPSTPTNATVNPAKTKDAEQRFDTRDEDFMMACLTVARAKFGVCSMEDLSPESKRHLRRFVRDYKKYNKVSPTRGYTYPGLVVDGIGGNNGVGDLTTSFVGLPEGIDIGPPDLSYDEPAYEGELLFPAHDGALTAIVIRRIMKDLFKAQPETFPISPTLRANVTGILRQCRAELGIQVPISRRTRARRTSFSSSSSPSSSQHGPATINIQLASPESSQAELASQPAAQQLPTPKNSQDIPKGDSQQSNPRGPGTNKARVTHGSTPRQPAKDNQPVHKAEEGSERPGATAVTPRDYTRRPGDGNTLSFQGNITKPATARASSRHQSQTQAETQAQAPSPPASQAEAQAHVPSPAATQAQAQAPSPSPPATQPESQTPTQPATDAATIPRTTASATGNKRKHRDDGDSTSNHAPSPNAKKRARRV